MYELIVARRRHGVDDDATTIGQQRHYALHHLAQTPTVPTDEDSVGTRQMVEIGFKEIANHRRYARSTEVTGIDIYKRCSLWPYLKSHNLHLWKL